MEPLKHSAKEISSVTEAARTAKQVRWQKFCHFAFILSVVAFVVVAVLPQTGWIVRLQMVPFMAGAMQTVPKNTARPDDKIDVQIAAALQTSPGKEDVEKLLPLRARFDNEPALQATILRYLSREFSLARIEESEMGKKPTPEAMQKSIVANEAKRNALGKTDRIAQFEAASAKGEEVDPDNAFFPFLRAAVLFLQHRDDEALAAVHRAAGKKYYSDYGNREVFGRVELLRRQQGEVPSVARGAIFAAILFPQYALMRSEARVITALAIQKELSGDSTGGFTIRRDLSRIGALMRVGGESYIASLVGSALTNIASVRPGGAAEIELKSNEEEIAAKLAAYTAYLNDIGQADEATWFTAERTKQNEVKNLFSKAQTKSFFGDNMWQWAVLGILWASGVVLALNLFWVVLMRGAAHGLARSVWFREARPLPSGVRVAFIALGVHALVSYLAWTGVRGTGLDTGIVPFLGWAFVVLAGSGLLYLKRRETGNEQGGMFRQEAIAFVMTLFSTLLILGGVVALGTMMGMGVKSFLDSVNFASPTEQQNNLLPQIFLGTLILLFAPILLSLGGIINGVRYRQPIAIALVRHIRNNALGVLSALLLLYVALVVALAPMEAHFRAELDAMMTHEGRYYARLAGTEWPGVVGEKGKGQ